MSIRIRPYSGERDYKFYIDGLKVNGKRRRFHFRTKTEATQKLAELEAVRRRSGRDGLNISEKLRVEAVEAAKLLEPFPGETILQAVRAYVTNLSAIASSRSVRELVDDFLTTKGRLNLSWSHTTDLRNRLNKFRTDFGNHSIRTISSELVSDWLHTSEYAPRTVNNFRAVLHNVFSYAVRKGQLEKNPIANVEKIKVVGGPPAIFTPEELSSFCSTQLLLPCYLPWSSALSLDYAPRKFGGRNGAT